MTTTLYEQLLVHHCGSSCLPFPGSYSLGEDPQEGQMATKFSLSLLMVGPALTRENALSNKNSQLKKTTYSLKGIKHFPSPPSQTVTTKFSP